MLPGLMLGTHSCRASLSDTKDNVKADKMRIHTCIRSHTHTNIKSSEKQKHTLMHKIIHGSSIFRKDTLRHFHCLFFLCLPLRGTKKTRFLKRPVVTGILSALQHSSQGVCVWMDVPESIKLKTKNLKTY